MEQQKHSGIGIASFVIATVSGLSLFVVIAIAGIMKATGNMADSSSIAVLIGLFMFAFLAGALVALGLGIAGLMQKERKKIFPLLGTIFSVVSLLITCTIVAIGLAAR